MQMGMVNIYTFQALQSGVRGPGGAPLSLIGSAEYLLVNLLAHTAPRAGEPYHPSDPELYADRVAVRRLLRKYNYEVAWEDRAGRRGLLKEAGIKYDAEAPPHFEPPVHMDYGYNITVGKDFYCNFNTVFLDICPITIGDRVMLAPGVQLYAAKHPLDAVERNGPGACELGAPITIEDDVWVGGAAIILPGITVGARSVVAAGAVVTKDVPADVVVAGNPAKIIKRLA